MTAAVARSGVALHDLTVGWGQHAVMANVNLEIDFEQFNRRVPIIGRTGLGKTTLLYAIAGQASPLGGRIKWRLPGQNVAADFMPGSDGSSAAELRVKTFSFAFQDATLVPFLTIEENLRLPLRLRGRRLPRAEEDRQVARLLGQVVIETEDVGKIRESFPTKLSGGQKQRMALAQALATGPTVLFSDEPTGSLDPLTRTEIMGVVDRWLDDDHSRCFFWITHHREADEFSRSPFVLSVDRGRNEHTTVSIKPSGNVVSAAMQVEAAQ